MALADRRPLGFPVTSTPASPAFNPKTLSLSSTSTTSTTNPTNNEANPGFRSSISDLKGNFSESDIKPLTPEKSLSPVELSPTSRSISPDSLMNSDSYRKLNATIAPSSTTSITSNSSRGTSPSVGYSSSNSLKKPKSTSRAPIATGISTTIPVTGEKPKPSQKDDPSLEDDVLYAIFVILFERDPEGSGMTVKQICDILVEQHPEMANLSTKTSNLVSAKLNAYVKRVEKGDSNLKYALSRDWADASPKRMVYVYRGLLTEDFHLHVKNVMEIQKQQHQQHQVENPSSVQSDDSSTLEIGKQADALKPRRQTMFDLGVTKNTFLDNGLDKSNLVVPYFSAPVTASLTDSNGDSKKNVINHQDSDLELEEFEVFNDDEDDENGIDLESNDMYIDSYRKNGKRSKSLSYLSLNKKPRVLTAAAAAPRAPRTPCSHSPNAAAAAAALHAAACKAISAPSSQLPESEQSIKSSSANSKSNKSPCLANKKWLNVVRSGFLTQDIGTPEEISLSDLDKFFA